MKRISAVILVAVLMGALAAPCSAEKVKDPKVLFAVGQKLVSKGENGVIAMARIAKAVTFVEAKEWGKAIEELKFVDGEVKDPEILFVTNALKIVVLKKSKQGREATLAELDKIIAAAKERRGH